MQEARQLLAGRKLQQAENTTRQYLSAHPKSSEGMFLLGRILEAQKQPKESLQCFTKAAELGQPNGEDLRLVGMDYVLLESWADAVHWLRRSVELDSTNHEAWYDLGRALMMLGDLRGARVPLERSLILQPLQAKVANNLGIIAESENQPDKAIELYRSALEWQEQATHPSEQPFLNLGTLFLSQGRGDEARPLLRQAVILAASDAKCHEQLARAEEQLGNISDAVVQMQAAAKLQPKSARLHYELGQLYRRAGSPEKGTSELLLSGRLYGTHSSDADRELR